MKHYMLDTNIVSQLLRRHERVLARVMAVPMASLCISSITRGELMFGLAKRPDNTPLALLVGEFLKRVDILPWNDAASDAYGPLRAGLERHGRSLAPLDLLIAAHARATDAVLVTNDGAFAGIPGLTLEDWTVAHA